MENKLLLTKIQRDFFFLSEILIGQLVVVAYSIADVIIIGRTNPDLLGGLALGNAIYVPIIMTATAFYSAATIKAAKIGAETGVDSLRDIAYYGFASAIVVGTLVFCALKYFATIHHWSNQSPYLVLAAQGYLDTLALSALPSNLFRVIAALANSIRATGYITALQAIGLIIKVALSLVLIDSSYFRFGLSGCGLSTAITFYVIFVGSLLLFLFNRNFFKFHFDLFLLSRKRLQLVALCKTGVPVALSTFAEFATFGYMTILIGRFGVQQLGAHQVVSNLNVVAETVSSSLAVWISVKISNALVLEGRSMAVRKARSAILIAVAIGFLLTALQMFFGTSLFRLYADDQGILVISGKILPFESLLIFANCVLSGAAATLRARGINAFPALMQVIGLWIGVAILGDGFAMQRLQLGDIDLAAGPGVWCGVFLGLLLSALMVTPIAIGDGNAIRRYIQWIRGSLAG
ncbi:MATE family efflux transporter [Paraburkholderia caribensis]|uniref:Multi antimicrobial extrusion protein MatE n=2 Tax=Paraburkholderia TaxID=1822464 RepID=B2JY46_PARP8|nr:MULTISPECIES: MATE family efflux transporter [Paraburkholderia]ACC76554.1 multi antimicrobial extrusion protein MatE [Paraburkholderia phymatum STM815]MCO4881996.1 multi anti extrusion protein MatE [Paraburkholderia caribensis]PTB24578.1 multi anti extrusion protein MatE [Paraburkholderia caribensis]